MFDALANGFRQAKNRLAGLTELTEQNIDTALREVRLSLLEADVELGVVKAFLARVKEKALGEVVRVKAKRNDGQTVTVSAGDRFTKICYDELVEFMSSGDASGTLKTGTPICSPRILSCSTAAGRCMSAATRSGFLPCFCR